MVLLCWCTQEYHDPPRQYKSFLKTALSQARRSPVMEFEATDALDTCHALGASVPSSVPSDTDLEARVVSKPCVSLRSDDASVHVLPVGSSHAAGGAAPPSL